MHTPMPSPFARLSIIWPDKTVLSADTAGQIIECIAALQWDQPCTHQMMRTRLVDRALAWSGTEIDDECADLDLLRALAAAGLFVLFEPFDVKGK